MTTVTPSARRVTSIRHRLRGSASLSPAAMASVARPSSAASVAAASALLTWCSPYSRSCTGAEPCAVTSVNPARPASSAVTPTARTSASAARPKVTTRAAVLAAMASTRGSSAFSTATPPIVPAGSAAGSSLLALATCSMPPNSPACAWPTHSTAPSRGGAMAHSAAMCPGPRADSSEMR